MKIRYRALFSGILLFIITLNFFPFYQFSAQFNIENENIQYLTIEEIENISINNSTLYQNSTLEREFFKTYNWLLNKSTVSNSPLNISGITAYFNITTPSESISQHYVEIFFDIQVGYSDGLKVFSHSKNNIFNLNFTMIENSDSIRIVTQNEKTLSYREGDMFLPFYYGWYIKEINNESASISYTSWQTLTPFIQSTVRMYLSTYNKTYLEIARPIVDALILHQTEEGFFIRQYGHEKNPVIIGMVQGIAMYTLLEYYTVTGDKKVSESLLKAASAFTHSTEGTTNHWTNSVLGSTISRLLLFNGDQMFEKNEVDALLGLYEEDGKITYNLPGNTPYPYYKESYWTYDARIFMRLAKFLKSEEIYNKIFPTAFNFASNNLNSNTDRVNNLLSLYHSYSLGLHSNDDRFLTWAYDYINPLKSNTSIQSTFEALDYLHVISTLFSWKTKNPFVIGVFPLSQTSRINLFSSESLHIDFKIRIANFGKQNLKLKLFLKSEEGSSIGKAEYFIESDLLRNDIYTVVIPNINIDVNLLYKVAISDQEDNNFYVSEWNQINILKFRIINSFSLFLLGLIIKLVLIVIFLKKIKSFRVKKLKKERKHDNI